MSAFKGTAGPWMVGRQNNIQTAHESPLDWKGIAQYMGGGQEAEANARLIAAAPDLLEALLIAREFAAYAQAEPADLALIDDAIAKALGEQS